MYHSHATEHDCLLIQHRDNVNPDEIVLFDKAYNNYKQFAKWNEREINFVTRLKNNAQERLIEEFELSPATPDDLLSDAKIALKPGWLGAATPADLHTILRKNGWFA